MAKTVLNALQIKQKIERLALQIIEDNLEEKYLEMVGIPKSGFVFAQKLKKEIELNCSLSVTLHEIDIDKKKIEEEFESYKSIIPSGKSVLLVDDVLNSGKTLMYTTAILLKNKPKKLRNVVLVDRRHRNFPIKADFAGLTLSTTIENHIEVSFGKEGGKAVLK